MKDNTQHPNVRFAFGAELFPERKDPQTLYLYATVPGKPLTVACHMNATRFALLQEVVREQNLRVFGYNAERRPGAYA